jgi:hypothetical protein
MAAMTPEEREKQVAELRRMIDDGYTYVRSFSETFGQLIEWIIF